MKNFTVTRKQITDAALSMLGWKFRHQGRGENNSVDCVGFLVCVGRAIGYAEIFDFNDYKRTPSAATIREMMNRNCDEIPLTEVSAGDVYLMRRIGGRKECHVAIRLTDETDLGRGKVPTLIHAYGNQFTGGVIVEPVSQHAHNFVTGYRIRGLADV